MRVWGNYGVIIGDKGIYYTTTGVDDMNGWKDYKITTSTTDSLLLSRSRFKQLGFNEKSPVFYLCGNDTVNKKAVILKIDIQNLTHAFIYTGAAGSQLNSLIFVTDRARSEDYLQAVGNKGLFVSYSISKKTSSTTFLYDRKDLKSVFFRQGNALTSIGISSDSNLYVGGGYSVGNMDLHRWQAKVSYVNFPTLQILGEKNLTFRFLIMNYT